MPRLYRLPVVILTLSATLVFVSGCATMKLPTFKTPMHAVADADHPVSQIVCMWQPADGRGLDELPSRGFAGQIVFLSANSPTPVEVQGDVTIYLFDDQASVKEQSRPLHVFRFVDGSWQTHLKTTTWGPTYQLFLPYVRKGSHRASCSLIAKIDTPDGRRVTSEMASIVLPGSTSLIEGESSPFLRTHSRTPAGRVNFAGTVEGGDATGVVAASARSSVPTNVAARPGANNQAPKFESFSIPYDFHQANSQK